MESDLIHPAMRSVGSLDAYKVGEESIEKRNFVFKSALYSNVTKH